MSLPKSLYDLPRTLLGFHVALSRRPAPRSGAAGSLEQRVARLEATLDITRLLHQYAYAYDDGDIEAMMEIYSDDCVIINHRGTFAGTESIRSNYEEAISARGYAFHHLADVEISTSEDISEGWATGYLHNLAVRDGNAGGTMASCIFHVRRFEDRWKVVECRIVVTNQHSYEPAKKRNPVPDIARPTSPETVAALIDP
jgi:ketosteroid isomerase-like protein